MSTLATKVPNTAILTLFSGFSHCDGFFMFVHAFHGFFKPFRRLLISSWFFNVSWDIQKPSHD